MVATKEAFNWQSALSETYQEVVQQMINHIPQLLGVIALLIVGWAIAWVLRLLSVKLIRGLERLLQRTAQKRGTQPLKVRSYARLAGDVVFWSVLLFFIATSANLLNWKLFSGVASALLIYLPNVLAGLLIILAGFALSGVARSAVAGAAESTGIEQADLIARIAQATVILTALVIGAEQLGINVAFLTTTLIVVAGVLLSGVALAFGLGAKDFVANVIGAQTARKYYHLGQRIKLGDIEGYLLEITPTMMVLDTQQGRAVIPAKFCHELIAEISVDQEGNGESAGHKEGITP